MKIYSDGKNRVIKGNFPKRFKLLNAGAEVPFLRTAADTIRLSGELPVGALDVEEIVAKKVAQPAKLDATSLAIINKADFDRIDILNKKLAINQEQMNAQLGALTEHEATLANLETQNAKAIEETNANIVEMVKAVGKEIQADRESIKNASASLSSSLRETGDILSSKIEAHEKAKNPHNISKATIGLDKVDNTSDLDKPISKAIKKALDKKVDKSELEEVNKKLTEARKKHESFVRSIENANLYGGVGGNELPIGGKKGQVLTKKSELNGDVCWEDSEAVGVHNDLSGRSDPDAHPISAITDLQTELTGLQEQIDAFTVSSDVKDVVGTYQDLENYDTSTLGDNDIIKVLQDETHDDETTYYRWSTETQSFTLIGEEGPYYTKAAADSQFVPQTRTVNDKALSSNITLSASDVGALPDNTFIPTDTSDLTNGAGYITGISSTDVTDALGYTPYDASNPAGYTTNVGTVTKVNNTSPDSSGNVSLTIPSINSSNNYVPYRSSATAFSNSTLMYNSSAMAFTGKLHVGSTSPGSYSNFGRFTIYDNTPGQQVTSMALLNYGGGGGCGVAIDMYNTSANSNIPSGRFGVVDNGNYSGYLQLKVKKSGASANPLLPAMNIVPVPATNSLTTCVSFGQDEFNRVLFDLHKPEEVTVITDSDKRWSGSGTTYSQSGSNKFNNRLLVAVGDIVYFNAGTEARVVSVVSNSSTLSITTDVSLGSISNKSLYVKKAYFKITDENNNTKIYVDPYGKFAIGKINPSYDLDVNGTINASTDVKINGQSVALSSSVPTDTSDLTNGAGFITSSALSGYQTTANLVTSVSSASTDSEYPSAKLFYDTCGDIETLINAL